MKQRSLFSLTVAHKQMLRELAVAGNLSMTALLQELIAAAYKHHDEYQAYLRGETLDPRD